LEWNLLKKCNKNWDNRIILKTKSIKDRLKIIIDKTDILNLKVIKVKKSMLLKLKEVVIIEKTKDKLPKKKN